MISNLIICFIVYRLFITVLRGYIEYQVNITIQFANLFRHLAHMHINSNRAISIFSIEERIYNLERINKVINKYISYIKNINHDFKHINISLCVELFLACDEMNYITVQTSAHELEYIVWKLIKNKVYICDLKKIIYKADPDNILSICFQIKYWFLYAGLFILFYYVCL